MTSTLERPVDAPSPAPRSPAARALTWTGGVVGGLLLLSGAYSAVDLLVLGSEGATTTSASATYGAAGEVELVADGDVTVTTGGDRVEVERTGSTALARPDYRVDETADHLRVSYQCDWWRPGFCKASLDVTVPEGTAVVVRASDGSVRATALRGTLDVRSGDGETVVSDVVGDVAVRTGDGRTEVSDIRGSVDASASDGSVSVSDVSGSVTSRVNDGRTEISGIRGSVVATASDGSVAVSDVAGRVTTRVNDGRTEIWAALDDVDATASDGDVTVWGTGEPVALDMSTADGAETVEGPVDSSSSVHVRIRTNDGNAAYLRPRG